MEHNDFEAIRALFSQPGRIVVTAHANPDGDAIGASLALAFYLRKKGHEVEVLVPDPFPGFLSWMPGSEEILIYSQEKERCLQIIAQAGVIISADYNQLDRLNSLSQPVIGSGAVRILIDHHLNPSDEFDYMISETKVSSTSELVYQFIEAADEIHLLDKQMAECLYAGIITDTGSLSYACNFVKTYLIVAELFRLGIDGEHLHRLIYDTYSEDRLRLLGFSISDQLVVLPEYHTAFIYLSKEDLQRFRYQIGDTEGIVNYALSIKDINLAALFMERDGMVKVSFRSKGNFSVNQLARNCFGGGGHRNAAGANCYTSLQDAVAKFRSILPDYQEQLKQVY